ATQDGALPRVPSPSRAAVVDAHHDVAVVGDPLVHEVARGEGDDERSGGTAVDLQPDGVLLAGVEIARPYHRGEEPWSGPDLLDLQPRQERVGLVDGGQLADLRAAAQHAVVDLSVARRVGAHPDRRVARKLSRMQIGAARDRARGAAAQRDLVELPVLRVGAAEDHQNAARLVEMLEAGEAEVERRERPQDGPVGLAQLELPLAARLGAPEESGAARQPTGIPPR